LDSRLGRPQRPYGIGDDERKSSPAGNQTPVDMPLG
jgi:hypothetical protein